MSDVVPANQVSEQTLEHVLGTGDISRLTTAQRVEFYRAACKSLGLNPLTRPIRFLTFQGQMQAYFTRDGTDQLRKNNKITLHVVDKRADGDVYVVTVRARMPDGREDEDMGAVTMARLQGDARANALMKCLTKAKRRVTLSICGLGWASEDELETMPGVQTFDHDTEPAPPSRREQINRDVPLKQEQPERKLTWPELLQSFELAIKDAGGAEEIMHILNSPQMSNARLHIGNAQQRHQEHLDRIMVIADERLAALRADADKVETVPDEEAPAIKGEEYVRAG